MELQHVNVKLLLQDPEGVDLEALVPVFHRWIQEQVGDELLLDVADYRHVSSGPGVVLIGHEGNYSLDNVGGRLGVRYNRKLPLEGTNQDRLMQAAKAALNACIRLQDDPLLNGRVRFNGSNIDVWINDRLLAPNTPETRRAAAVEFESFFSNLFAGRDFQLEYPQDGRALFGVRASNSTPLEASALLENLRAFVLTVR